MPEKVIIADYEYPDVNIEVKLLKEAGYNVETYPIISDEEEFISVCKDSVAILCQKTTVTKKMISGLNKCKVILHYGIGYDMIDINTASQKGIKVLNVPDYCQDEVSDHTLALLLSSIRKIPELDRNIRSKIWDYKSIVPTYRVAGHTLGFIGFGSIARSLAKKVSSLNLNLIAYDPYVDKSIARKYNIRLLNFEEVIKKSDYISLHLPLNSETEGIISEREFNLMKKSVILINTSRGKIINQKALINALEQGKIHYAALDAFPEEPINWDNPLLNMENVILTPHIGWYSEQSIYNLQKKAAQYVIEALQGKNIAAIVN